MMPSAWWQESQDALISSRCWVWPMMKVAAWVPVRHCSDSSRNWCEDLQALILPVLLKSREKAGWSIGRLDYGEKDQTLISVTTCAGNGTSYTGRSQFIKQCSCKEIPCRARIVLRSSNW